MVRSRVAVPVAPPVLTPSLIPHDVLHEVDREEQVSARFEAAAEDRDPTTAPVALPDDVVLMNEVRAEPEVTARALSSVALFETLTVESRAFLSGGATVLTVPSGELLFTQGEPTSSFYVVIDGQLDVVVEREGRPVGLRTFGPGEAVGLFEALCARPRTSSARATGDTSVVVFAAQKLGTVVARDEALRERLFQVHRERLLDGMFAHPALVDVDGATRSRLRSRMTHRELPPGHALLNPGEVTNVIAVVTSGTLIFEGRTGPTGPSAQVELGAGQFFALTCAQSGVPSRHRLMTRGGATVSMASHHATSELLREAASLQPVPQRLGALGQQLDRDLACGTIDLQGQ